MNSIEKHKPILQDSDFEKHGFEKHSLINGFYTKTVGNADFEITYFSPSERISISLRTYEGKGREKEDWDSSSLIHYLYDFIILEPTDLDFICKRIKHLDYSLSVKKNNTIEQGAFIKECSEKR